MCLSTRYWQNLTRPLANTSVLRLSESASKILTLSRNFGTVTKRTFTRMIKLIVKNRILWLPGKPDVVAEAPLCSVKITRVMITGQQGRHRALLPRRRQRRHADCQRSAVPGGAGEISEGPQDKAEEQYGSPPILVVATWLCPAHTAQETQNWLQERLGERVMSMFETCPWPSSPPDLTPSEFFMWGHFKSHVYRTSSRSLWDLKEAVKSVVGCVSPPCVAIRRRPRCAELNCASSEMGVTANMSSARPGKVPLGIGSALKENIIEQAVTWYPIRGSITDTTGKMQVLNSSDFFRHPVVNSLNGTRRGGGDGKLKVSQKCEHLTHVWFLLMLAFVVTQTTFGVEHAGWRRCCLRVYFRPTWLSLPASNCVYILCAVCRPMVCCRSTDQQCSATADVSPVSHRIRRCDSAWLHRGLLCSHG